MLCRIIRDKTSTEKSGFPTYYLKLEKPGYNGTEMVRSMLLSVLVDGPLVSLLTRFPPFPLLFSSPRPTPPQVDLLVARKIKKAKSSYYLVCTNVEDLNSEGGNRFVAKLRANVLGTKVSVFDNGVSPSKRDLPENEGMPLREELACVLYVSRGRVREEGMGRGFGKRAGGRDRGRGFGKKDRKRRAAGWSALQSTIVPSSPHAILTNDNLQETNLLGFKGPRKMTAILPRVERDGRKSIVPETASPIQRCRPLSCPGPCGPDAAMRSR